eukprot:jgi/Undpi1/11737/HiC_scaffold_37.g14032.m1
MRLSLLATILASAASSLAAQDPDIAPLSMSNQQLSVDSGYLDAVGSGSQLLFDHTVRTEAPWLRLHFGDTNLPTGSRLRLTSEQDGAVQYFDARSLRDYGFGSAWFNGGAVRVELLAAEGTVGNRVQIVRAELGPDSETGNDSICGSTDDRTLATDPRVGRAIHPTYACTWWLISECTIVTAGHCSQGVTTPTLVAFNIPLSTGGGVYVQPPPDDQYPLLFTFRQEENTGVGGDWGVMNLGRNSNHGLYPGDRQGAWFNLGTVPGSISGVDIRITGNGRVTAPVSPTWNAATKTHLGPRLSTSRANALRYQTDTTGGNSGSPIIHEQTGNAIGVHTHGGCSSSGGGNYGTRVDKPVFANAVQAAFAAKTCGRIDPFGIGCAGSAGTPDLSVTGFPDIGETISVNVQNLTPGEFGILLYGFSDQTFQGNSLPADLTTFGLVGCTLLVAPDVQVFAPSDNNGASATPLTLPNLTSFVGFEVFFQHFATDPLSTNGAVLSDGAAMRIGN